MDPQSKFLELISLVQSSPVKPEFNFFTAISPIYHRENLHSDILYQILDQGPEVMLSFLEFLRRNPQCPPELVVEDFRVCHMTREKERIDIWIVSEVSRKAIIIENKINNAGDTDRQLPDYLRKNHEKGFEVVAIVYLSVTGKKMPGIGGYDDLEMREVKRHLVTIGLGGKETGLIDGWLGRVPLASFDLDFLVYLKHYRKLLGLLLHRGGTDPRLAQIIDLAKHSPEVHSAIKKDEGGIRGKVAEYYQQNLFFEAMQDDLIPFHRLVTTHSDYATFQGWDSPTSTQVTVEVLFTRSQFPIVALKVYGHKTNDPAFEREFNELFGPQLIALGAIQLDEGLHYFVGSFDCLKDESAFYTIIRDLLKAIDPNPRGEMKVHM